MKTPLLIFYSLFLPAIAVAEASYDTYLVEKNRINSLGDRAVITHAQKSSSSDSYVIVDKKNQTAEFFVSSESSPHTYSIKAPQGDQLQQGCAGIYYYVGQKNNTHYGKAEKDNSIHPLFSGTFRLKENTPIYILSLSSEHRFRIRNNELTFNAHRVLRERRDMNYSPVNLTSKDSRFMTDFTDSFTQAYVQTLEKEKRNLMELFSLENDEYNMLARFAFGVLSPETDYGNSWSYRLKQRLPLIVSLGKGNGFNTEENSRGPTQIKVIPPLIVEKYGIQKHQLRYPENAAIATVGFAVDLLKEIRNRAPQHPDISEETLLDFMYYLYQGRRYEIKQGTATPDQNISIRKIKEALDHLHIYE